MTRKAVIYIRTSSETQGEKTSPVEQETDCLCLAQEKGLKVVGVYRDVENIGLAPGWSSLRAVVQTAPVY